MSDAETDYAAIIAAELRSHLDGKPMSVDAVKAALRAMVQPPDIRTVIDVRPDPDNAGGVIVEMVAEHVDQLLQINLKP